MFIELAKLGIDTISASHFIGSDEFTPSESMIDWRSGKPNARYHARQLISQHFQPSDVLIKTRVRGKNSREFLEYSGETNLPEMSYFSAHEVAAQVIRTAQGIKILLVNKEKDTVEVDLGSMGQAASMDVVDEKSGYEPARKVPIKDSLVHLEPFAVAVVTIN